MQVDSSCVLACTGRAQYLLSPSPYILGILLAGSIVFQMRYLQRALDRFSTSVVTPLLYVLFTSAVVTASLVLFREWANIPPAPLVGTPAPNEHCRHL